MEINFIQNVAKVHVDEPDANSNPVKVYVKGDKSNDPDHPIFSGRDQQTGRQ